MNRVLVSLQEPHRSACFHPLLQIRPTHQGAGPHHQHRQGLAGALNTNIMREAATYDKEKTVYVTAGRKARQFIARTRRELLADFELKDSPTILETKAISKFCLEKFLNGEVDKVTVLYTHFVNTINQQPVAQTLLPIDRFAFGPFHTATHLTLGGRSDAGIHF